MKNQHLQSDTMNPSTGKSDNWSNQLTASPTETNKVLRIKQTAAYLGISEPTLWRLNNTDPTFPEKLKLGVRARGYRKSDLDKWLQQGGAA